MARRSRKIKPRAEKVGVFCEGETEQKYFAMLRRKYSRQKVESHKLNIKSEHVSGAKLLEVANAKANQQKYDRVYVVFDRDDKSTAELQQCQKLSKRYGITMLVSSECFEVWLLLHYGFSSSNYSRKQLYRRLSDSHHFNRDYVATKGEDLYMDVGNRIHIAERNGNRLLTTNSELSLSQPFTNVSKYLREIFDLSPTDQL